MNVARVKRSETRDSAQCVENPGLRFAPSGLRMAEGLAAKLL
jgi:hypothetical protein